MIVPMLTPLLRGFLQAAGIALYIFLLNVFFSLSLFPQEDPPASPSIFLLLFCFSALLCGTLVFAHPAWLILQGKKSEALTVFLSTVVSLGIILIVTVAMVISMIQ